MRLELPLLLSRVTLTGLVASLALTGDPASARPRRATKKVPARAGKIERRIVKVSKAHIKPASKGQLKRAGKGTPSGGPGSVQPNDPGEVEYVLSANTPYYPYRARLIGYYPREWRPEGEGLGPGGEIWLSQHQVPHGSYAVARLNVEPGFDYEVTLCTGGGTTVEVRATVGDTTHTFSSWTDECDMTLVLKPEWAGWTDIKLDFADPPSEHGANAYAINRIEVVRRPQ